jgi:hypothetical protein
VGKAVLGGGVDGRIVVTDGLADADTDARDDTGADACAGEDACADADDVCAAPDGDVAAEERAGDPEVCPVGEEAWAPDWAPVWAPVCGVGRNVEGIDPPPVQADTAAVTRTTPAAERPTVSHAPRAPPGTVRRIFMNPPRMRVR